LEVKLIYASDSSYESSSTDNVGELLEEAEGRDQMSEWAEKFIGELRERYDKYGERIRMSPKQMSILAKIARGTR